MCTVPLIWGCGADETANDYWPMHTIDDGFEGADGVDAGDVDGDGDRDLLVGWEESGRVMLYEHPGVARVLDSWQRTDVSGGMDVTKIEDAKFADLDGDGRIDAVVSATENRNQTVNVHWLVDSDRPFSGDAWRGAPINPSIQQSFVKVAIGQVDGAGASDIVVGSKADQAGDEQAQLLLYRTPGPPTHDRAGLWRGDALADIHWATTIEILDLDRDGDNDILLSDWNMLAWFENPRIGNTRAGNTSWVRHLISEEADSVFANCAPEDEDNGAVDLVVSVVSARDVIAAGDPVFFRFQQALDEAGQWTGGWIESSLRTAAPLPADVDRNDYDLKGVACGDIDGNEELDLVVSASGYGHGVFALMNMQRDAGDQQLELTVIADDRHNTRKGIKHDNLLLDDIDGDGDLDVITTEESGNTGGSLFANPFSYLLDRGLGLIWFENPR